MFSFEAGGFGVGLLFGEGGCCSRGGLLSADNGASSSVIACAVVARCQSAPAPALSAQNGDNDDSSHFQVGDEHGFQSSVGKCKHLGRNGACALIDRECGARLDGAADQD